MIKKLISIIACVILLCIALPSDVKSEAYKPGYSEWSTEKTGAENEVSTIQYGRKLPIEWSKWSNIKTDSLYQKQRDGETRHYAYDGEQRFWDGAYAKDLFTIDFKVPSKVIYLYVDVDGYVDPSYTNYIGPPLQAYCDGKLVASVGLHDYNANWNPSLNCTCTLLKVSMSSAEGEGRNHTSIVGSWAATSSKEYSYVTKWSEGQDWRFDKKYPEKYGEESQIPVERIVYSHPIEYSINYELDGGTPLEELPRKYTILDEISLPAVYKEGYDFIGFHDEKGRKIERIEKGSHKDYYLYALYERKAPTIYASTKYFEKSDKALNIKDFLEAIKASAKDELDGDISKDIIVDYIIYSSNNNYVPLPNSVDISLSQKLEVCLSVTNSGGKQAKIIKSFYILENHEIKEFSEDNLKIYTRYISSDYQNTLDKNSIWYMDDYQDLLNEAFKCQERR